MLTLVSSRVTMNQNPSTPTTTKFEHKLLWRILNNCNVLETILQGMFGTVKENTIMNGNGEQADNYYNYTDKHY